MSVLVPIFSFLLLLFFLVDFLEGGERGGLLIFVPSPLFWFFLFFDCFFKGVGEKGGERERGNEEGG